jgi:hypothetical protein
MSGIQQPKVPKILNSPAAKANIHLLQTWNDLLPLSIISLLMAVGSEPYFSVAMADGGGAEDSGAEGSGAAEVVFESKVTALYRTVSNVLPHTAS